MVEIIKPGVRKQDVTHDATCRDCRCEFRFKTSEANRVFDQRDGDFLQLACPFCGANVTKAL